VPLFRRLSMTLCVQPEITRASTPFHEKVETRKNVKLGYGLTP